MSIEKRDEFPLQSRRDDMFVENDYVKTIQFRRDDMFIENRNVKTIQSRRDDLLSNIYVQHITQPRRHYVQKLYTPH